MNNNNNIIVKASIQKPYATQMIITELINHGANDLVLTFKNDFILITHITPTKDTIAKIKISTHYSIFGNDDVSIRVDAKQMCLLLIEYSFKLKYASYKLDYDSVEDSDDNRHWIITRNPNKLHFFSDAYTFDKNIDYTLLSDSNNLLDLVLEIEDCSSTTIHKIDNSDNNKLVVYDNELELSDNELELSDSDELIMNDLSTEKIYLQKEDPLSPLEEPIEKIGREITIGLPWIYKRDPMIYKKKPKTYLWINIKDYQSKIIMDSMFRIHDNELNRLLKFFSYSNSPFVVISTNDQITNFKDINNCICSSCEPYTVFNKNNTHGAYLISNIMTFNSTISNEFYQTNNFPLCNVAISHEIEIYVLYQPKSYNDAIKTMLLLRRNNNCVVSLLPRKVLCYLLNFLWCF